jgi:hypothetical protein
LPFANARRNAKRVSPVAIRERNTAQRPESSTEFQRPKRKRPAKVGPSRLIKRQTIALCSTAACRARFNAAPSAHRLQ